MTFDPSENSYPPFATSSVPRGADVPWEEVEKLLQDRRDRLSQVEALRHQLKKGSDEVARLKRAKQPAEEAVAAMRALGDNIAIQEEHLRAIEVELEEHALRIPNLPHRHCSARNRCVAERGNSSLG